VLITGIPHECGGTQIAPKGGERGVRGFRSHGASTNQSIAMPINLDVRSTPAAVSRAVTAAKQRNRGSHLVTLTPAVASTVTSRPTDLPAQPQAR